MNCFGFGTTFSPPVKIDLTPLLHLPQQREPCSGNLLASDKSHVSGNAVAVPRTGDDDQFAASSPSAALLSNGNSKKSAGKGKHHGRGTKTEQKPHALLAARHATNAVDQSTQQTDILASGTIGATQQQLDAPASTSTIAQDGPDSQGHMAFAVHKAHAKAAKDSLRALGWLDRSCKAQTDSSSRICLPLTATGTKHLNPITPHTQETDSDHHMAPLESGYAATEQSLEQTDHSLATSAKRSSQADPSAHAEHNPSATSLDSESVTAVQQHPSLQHEANDQSRHQAMSPDQCLRDLMASCKGMLQPLTTVTSAKSGIGPAARLRQHVTVLLQEQVVTMAFLL